MSSPTTTTPVAAAPSTADTADSSAGEADAIPVLRGQIDALDAAICRLVSERARLSQRIQAARMNNGGTRVELGRERVILDAYRRALGSNGPSLADAILQVCRGAR
jgi:chorismate mutase